MANDLHRSIKIYLDTQDVDMGVDKLKVKITGLTQTLVQLSSAEGDNSAAIEKVKKQLESSNKTLANYEKKINETKRVLKNLSGATYNELLEVKRKMQNELRGESRETEKHKNRLEAYKQVCKEVAKAQKELNVEVGCQGTTFGKLANGFNKYIGLIAGLGATITGLSFKFRQLAEDVAKMDDTYADVMKTTGMTREQVKNLNEEFKKIDTRTSREELNLLARDAGKLGKTSKKDILDFVEAGNQIRVALGEDLGEDAIKNIGKITEVFTRSTKELDNMDLKGRMLSVGSAINELGQSSTASEVYLVEFAQRLGGVASQANISIQNILGYASALDQSGQAVEMSATSLQKFIMKLMGEPAKFAKIAGLEVDKFNKLLKEDTNAAIIEVLKALSTKGGFQALIPMFKDMGMDGARAVGVLSALATNIGKVTEAQAISNQAFSESTSITKEYDTKNNNLQASLEKARKSFKDAALDLGERLNPALLKSTNSMTYLIRALPDLIDWVNKYKGTLIAITAAIVAYTIAVNANTIASKLLAFWNDILIKSFKNLGNAMKTNIWGLVIAAITFLIVKYIEYTNKLKEATKAMEIFNNITEKQKELTDEYSKSIVEEKQKLNSLVGVIVSTNDNNELRNSLIKKLNETYPSFLKNLNLEKIENSELLARLRDVNNEYDKKLRMAALQAKTDALHDASVKSETRKLEIEEEQQKLYRDAHMMSEKEYKKKKKKLEDEYSELNRNIKIYQNKMTEYQKDIISKEQEIQETGTSIYYDKRIKEWDYKLKIASDRVKKAQENGNKNDEAFYQKQVDNARREVNLAQTKYDEIFKIEQAAAAKKDDNNNNDDSNNDYTPADKKGKSKEKKRFDLGLQKMEVDHKAKINLLNANQKEIEELEETHNLFLLDEEKCFYENRIKYLQNFKTNDEKLQTEINEKIEDDKTKLSEIITDYDRALIKEQQTIRDKGFKELQRKYDKEKADLDFLLAEKYISQEEYDANILIKEEYFSNAQLEIWKKYKDNIYALEISTGKLRQDAREEADANLTAAEVSAAQKRREMLDALADSEKNLLKIAGVSTLEHDLKIQLDSLKRFYDARVEMALEAGASEKEIESLKTAYLLAQNHIRLNAEQSRLDRRKQYGIATWQEEYNFEKDGLLQQLATRKTDIELKYAEDFKAAGDNAERIKEINDRMLAEMAEAEKEAQAGIKNIRVNFLKQWFDYYAGLITGAVSALQDAEMANIDAKYEAEFSAAKGNSDKIEQLENEKAQKKLDVEKKYADVNFAIKASQIIAETAVAIMAAWELGPIAGPIAAALVGITGAAQLYSANAERQKVKSMTLNGAGKSAPATGERVVTQAADGKYDVVGADDNRTYKNIPWLGEATTGMVYAPTLVGEKGKELIVSNDDFLRLEKHINYPLVISAINDARTHRVPQRAGGKYDTLSENMINSIKFDKETKEMLRLNNMFLKHLIDNGLEATSYIGITEYQAKLEQKNRTESTFTKK